MKIVSFSLLTVLALIYSALTLAETMTYRKWEEAVAVQQYTQGKLTYFGKLNARVQQMGRQMAIYSQTDPAIAQVLKDNKVRVIIEGPPTPGAGTGGDSSSSTTKMPSPSEKSAQSPSSPLPPTP